MPVFKLETSKHSTTTKGTFGDVIELQSLTRDSPIIAYVTVNKVFLLAINFLKFILYFTVTNAIKKSLHFMNCRVSLRQFQKGTVTCLPFYKMNIILVAPHSKNTILLVL